MISKTSIEDFIKTATFFYVDTQLENDFSNEIERQVNDIKASMVNTNTVAGLRAYIEANRNSLKYLINLLGVSEEKFKRIITMFRVKKGFIVTSEWTLQKIRFQMMHDHDFMDEVCSLLVNGSQLLKYKNTIPLFYLNNFASSDIVDRLKSDDEIRHLVKKGIEGAYNNKIGDKFARTVFDKITTFIHSHGLSFKTNQKILLFNEVADLVIPDGNSPLLVVNCSYQITTSSGQTKYAKKIESERQRIRSEGKSVILVTILDGAGWVARGSDLKQILDCSDYLLNLASLDSFDEILTSCFKL